MKTGMPFAFVAAVGGVGFEDVAVAGFQFFQDAAFVDYTGAAVVGECAEKDGVLAVLGVEGAELGEVFAEQCVGLCLGELYASAVWFSRLDLMTVANVGPMLRLMERFKLFDYQDCPLKERQFHYRPLCGDSWRSDREGHYRHEEYQDFFHKPMGVMVPGLTGVMIPGVLPPLSSPLSLLLNSKVCSHGVEPKLSSMTTRNLWASEDWAV